MTLTEKIVSELCENTFLSFWSFPNPIGKKLDKELCDILVICDPDIVIFSVKEINVKESSDYNVDFERWEREAIQKSVDQIYGAERIIQLKEDILLNDKVTKVKLPEKGIRKIYRVAVAFGRGEKFTLKFGDFGKGYVNVFDEISIQTVLQELDTITDFINFLKAKENFLKKGIKITFSEKDFLAMYLHNSLQLSKDHDFLIIDSNYWDEFSTSEEYLNQKKENKISYLWDGLITSLCRDFETDDLINEVSRHELELAIRLMNKETRIGRQRMSKFLLEVLGDGVTAPSIKTRIVFTELENAPLYIVMVRPHKDRECGRKELYLRCLVARSLFPDREDVIGIATEPYQKGKGYSLDLYYLNLSNWSEQQQRQAEAIKDDLGYFKSPTNSMVNPDGKRHYP